MDLKVHFVFPGNCEEALLFYSEVLNGKVDFLFRKGQDKSIQIPEADTEKISHMVVKTDWFELAGEDADSGKSVTMGHNIKLALKFKDIAECCRVYGCFSENGTVTMPLEKTFFTEAIGEVSDKYGIHWIIMMDDSDCKA